MSRRAIVLFWGATAASVFPYLGTIVYTIVRPPEYLDLKNPRLDSPK